MKTPTQEQLNSPEWWDETAPDEATHYSGLANRFLQKLNDFQWRGLEMDNWIDLRCAPSHKLVYERPKPQPAAAKPEGQEWDGKGIPPAGLLVECDWRGWDSWARGTVQYVGHDVVVVHSEGRDRVMSRNEAESGECFRPLNHDRDQAIDHAFSKLSQFREARQVLGELYDAGLLRKGGE